MATNMNFLNNIKCALSLINFGINQKPSSLKIQSKLQFPKNW